MLIQIKFTFSTKTPTFPDKYSLRHSFTVHEEWDIVKKKCNLLVMRLPQFILGLHAGRSSLRSNFL